MAVEVGGGGTGKEAGGGGSAGEEGEEEEEVVSLDFHHQDMVDRVELVYEPVWLWSG